MRHITNYSEHLLIALPSPWGFSLRDGAPSKLPPCSDHGAWYISFRHVPEDDECNQNVIARHVQPHPNIPEYHRLSQNLPQYPYIPDVSWVNIPLSR